MLITALTKAQQKAVDQAISQYVKFLQLAVEQV
jgi:hypothetical protein